VSGAASNSKKVVVEEEEEEEEEPSSTTDITTTATTTYSFLPHLYTLPKELDMSTKVYRHANLNSFLNHHLHPVVMEEDHYHRIKN
jgi:hypothetical protein